MNEELTPEQEALLKKMPPENRQKETQEETQKETQEETQETEQSMKEKMEEDIQKELNIFTKMREELKAHLKTYNNESAAYNSFQKCTDIGRKTLQNFFNGKGSPSPKTVLGFYKWYFKTKNEHEVLEKLSPETKWFLINNGYNTKADNQEISGLIFRTTAHYELYLSTEDGQIIKKSQVVKKFGESGVKALNELLIHEVVHAIDEEHFTTGKIRADLSIEYYRNATSSIAKAYPWDENTFNRLREGARFYVGNLVIALKDSEALRKTVFEYEKKLLMFHNRGLKEKHEERETFVLSSLIYKSTLERDDKGELQNEK